MLSRYRLAGLVAGLGLVHLGASLLAAQERENVPAAPAAAPLPMPQTWDTSYVMLLDANPAYRPASAEARQAVLQQHLQYQLRLIADGRTVLGGPLAQVPGAPLVGMTVLRAASLEEAEAIAHTDPGVAGGLFNVSVRTWTTAGTPRPPEPDAADVATLEGIMHAYYDVINGPPGQPRQWERDRTLYMPGARFVAMLEDEEGNPAPRLLTPEEYQRWTDAGFVAEGAHETETGSRVERWGNIAQVRSVGEFRRRPGGPVLDRYVNYVLLYWDGSRWWIHGAVWDTERPGKEIPEEWVGVQERVP
jgi:uncharacterized protein YciI